MSNKKVMDQGQIRAFLGEGTEFEGLLSFDGTVRIDGRFKGEIQTNDTLIIGESGHIEAEIKAGQCIIMGTLLGNVKTAGKVEITNTGRVTGNLNTRALVVQEGGLIEGSITMKKEAEQPKKVVNLQEASPKAAAEQRPH